MDEIIVDSLRTGEAQTTAMVLSKAFQTQPNVIAMLGSQDENARKTMELTFRISKLERPVSTAWVARSNGQIVGAANMAVWPHCQLTLGEMLKLMPQMIGRIRGKIFRVMQIQTAWKRHDPRQRHWHIGPIGVLPELQGHGIGSKLMIKCCEMIDAEKDPTYLETDRPENLPFYKHFGFRVLAEERILGVTNWFLWRDPCA